MGLVLYLACDDEDKAALRAEDAEKRFVLKGTDEGPQRFQLMEQIIRKITHDMPLEKYNEKSQI